MNKRYLHKITLLAASSLMLGLGSCKKYLDQQPITAVGPDFVFNSVETTRAALIGVYNQLTGDAGYGLRLNLYFSVGTDETEGPTGNADGSRRDFPLYATTPGNSQIFAPYTQLFKGIQYANVCIESIPKMDLYDNGSDGQKKQLQRMYGEALTLRAQFYAEAIRNWGDLPAHFTAAEELATQDPFPKRTDRDVLYDQILNDLKTAEALVPWRNEVTSIGDPQDERITKGTVKGLRARIALARAGYSLRQSGTMKQGSNPQTYYQIARDETNDIITSAQHSLNPSFKDLWKNQVGGRTAWDPNGELMFQVTAIGRTASADTKIGYNSGPTVVDLATQTGSTGTSSVFILPTYFYMFDSTDTRRDVTCVPYSDTLAPDGVTFYKKGQPITSVFDGKYRRDWLNPPLAAGTYLNNYSGFKWQILRYADVLLMFAEAENELNGPTTAAYNAINLVRRRAFGNSNNDIPAGLSKSDFFKYLVRERELELGAEGVRKYDLIRWNLLATAITESKSNIALFGTTTGTTLTGTLAQPSYMAGYPSYVGNLANLPVSMFYRARTASDDLNIGGIVLNSWYAKAPSSTPAGSTKVAWIVITTDPTKTTAAAVLAHYATNFVPNKSELLPIPQDAITAYGGFASNMPQNPGY
ncbi:RagB/SusD family nutrient uptake outer membrane protein [Flavisolibacter ginsenosidimutans]|uniref:RagB/SusD family nutrient uptake outer membrane protein n=1 Tax=Flavisolibacter ginsenosidimutans TaxID=661481 RepID=A0A5B8UMW1_9BACT|nr:RagB/SusD family nutrient uptake outer membrane protein [Flavisolibacter ginsenosidimutans]QEC58017.1 RagB/SusD family nutrient uptake outer membrane protein [Flavisolibacter ginsenosidimutans]